MKTRKKIKESYLNYFSPVIGAAGVFSILTLIIDYENYRSSYGFIVIINALILLFIIIAYIMRPHISRKIRELILIITGLLISLDFYMTYLVIENKKIDPGTYLSNLIIMIISIFLIISIVSIIRIGRMNTRLERTNRITGLGNISWISEHVNTSIQEGVDSGILLLIDIKNFRIINSIFGREYGNTLIQIVSDFLSTVIDENHSLAHIGGIEFCLWIKNEDKNKIETKLKNMKLYFKKGIYKDGKNVNLFIHSAGVIYPDHGLDFNQLFSRANMAMEKTQIKEYNTHVFYNPEIEKELTSENILSYEIQQSMEKGEFYICYQEKYDMEGTKVLGLEALARCHSSILGSLSPDIFIPIIHKMNLTIPFTDMIIEYVLADMNKIDRQYDSNVQVSINIPPLYFQSSVFLDFIRKILDITGVNPKRLIFEITEDIFIDGYESFIKILNELQILGIKISLDDFGTGYSSFSYIQNLPINELKIDKSFIDHICDDEKSFILVKAICDIAHANNYIVVAEGVEHEDQLRLLKKTSCDLIQGFIYSKPARIKGNDNDGPQ
ncbi:MULTISPECIES: bifunctional diguanylate cyclase/phosphodiesterase [unclassified Oceanispirochaeta]|uniref:putative bifunctional diguanylate cyclase/phosphodiesterase n=1 Tax=unclassified Oceanispirochaeta TaxID=2635722 RepID=UPI000E09B12D|nr:MULTISPECIES: bifunctional diguanylate cyclase/phosphodiesterase [unclassified Oceanispirochaeta]MBF9014189.1 bifunctional diguanylate cyclase/phosphodiesterase [Oceanispirochaeta sp. M2]NPD70679.1 bifunctional diguanylate cyclase/phosphodiesterase [Oceanispirochaeta sp. M1]RDG34439.1 bifunctional diguanylate cyclase/phosphodiesterase [Oceanispirochaeta sp. M1]